MPTFGGRVSPGARTRRLSPHECQAWLCSHHEGRLGYQTGKGPRSVVVSYAVAGDQILVRLPDYNDIVHYAPGSEVSLDVDGTPAAHRETVVVTGRAPWPKSAGAAYRPDGVPGGVASWGTNVDNLRPAYRHRGLRTQGSMT